MDMTQPEQEMMPNSAASRITVEPQQALAVAEEKAAEIGAGETAGPGFFGMDITHPHVPISQKPGPGGSLGFTKKKPSRRWSCGNCGAEYSEPWNDDVVKHCSKCGAYTAKKDSVLGKQLDLYQPNTNIRRPGNEYIPGSRIQISDDLTTWLYQTTVYMEK